MLLGEKISVNASIYTIGGFSAHADQAGLLAWHAKTGKPKTTFLVHGESESMQALAGKLQDTRVEMPLKGQCFELT